MTVNWALLAIAIVLYALSYLPALLALRTKEKYHRALLASVDGVLSVIALVVGIMAFSNHMWGAVICLSVQFAAYAGAREVLGADLEKWYREGYEPKIETEDESPLL